MRPIAACYMGVVVNKSRFLFENISYNCYHERRLEMEQVSEKCQV